jgi:hypothetical protein
MFRDPKDLVKKYYSPSTKEPQILTIPAMNFLMIDGHGDPNTEPSYPVAISVLYTMAYTLKFDLKTRGTPDFKVFPLQGLWWAENMDAFITGEKSAWDWTMMIAQPDWVTPEHIEKAKTKASVKIDKVILEKVRFETYDEGLVIQMMHIGPYSAEGPNIARIHAFAREQGYELSGKHHEVYLGNPQRSTPEKLKTIIRQPIRKAGS